VNVDVVVDAGNSFIKWGRCAGGKVVEVVSLKLADTDGWNRQRDEWALKKKCHWVVTGSDPIRRDALVKWLEQQNQPFQILDSHVQLPVALIVKYPEKVGLDRLFNAIAVNSRRPQGRAAVIIDAGTAVTVDYVDEAGFFQGGAILPGRRIMAELLFNHTAALPRIELYDLNQLTGSVTSPGKSTEEAMVLGINACFLGGIERVAWEYVKMSAKPPMIFVGGGDGPRIGHISSLGEQYLWPEMTLEGIRIAAER
jgi:type III pantothenate kinase